jgi:hypothetical protein
MRRPSMESGLSMFRSVGVWIKISDGFADHIDGTADYFPEGKLLIHFD